MRLEFNNVKFKNFLSYGKIQQDVDFLPGVNLVLGYDPEKERSNTSGKSSFLATIPFALFGKTDKDVKKEQLVNWRNRKNCEVILDFNLGDRNFTILRAIKPDKLEIYENNIPIPNPYDVRIFQRTLEEEILKIDHATFMSLFSTNLNSLVPILRMTKPQKRNFLERIFGLGLFSELNTLSNLKLNEVEKKLYAIKVETEVSEKSISELKTQTKSLESELQHLLKSTLLVKEDREKKKKVLSTYTPLKELEMNLLDVKVQRAELKELVDEDTKEYNSFEIQLSVIDTEIDGLVKQVRKLVFKEDDLQDLPVYEKQKEEILKRYGGKLLEAKSDVGNLFLESSRELKQSNKQLKDIELEKTRLTAKYELLGTKSKKLEGLDICPTCGAEIKDSNILKKIEQDRFTLGQEIVEKNADYNNARGKVEKWEREHEDNQKNFDRVHQDQLKLSELEGYIEKVQNLKLKEDEIERLKEQIVTKNVTKEDLESKLNLSNSKLSKKKKQIDKLNQEVDNLEIYIGDVQTLERELEHLQLKIDESEKSRKQIDTLIKRNHQKVKSYEDSQVERQTSKKKLNELGDYLEYIKTLCKDEYVKQYAISSIMPQLNRQVNHYLSESGMNFYVRLDKWLEEKIEGPGMINGSYGSLSGGEARSIDLALQFGFLDIARIKAGVFPDLLSLDELLDSSVDSVGLSSILDIVRTRQRDDNSKIFIITHRQEVDESTAIDNTYLIEKHGGFSYVKMKEVK